MKSIALFNNKGGVGKTTLAFNIAHMAARLGLRTVVLDYDPQCNVTSVFLDEDRLGEAWTADPSEGRTVAACIDLVRRGKGDVLRPSLEYITENLWLLPGHLSLSRFEQTLANEWSRTMAVDNERALDVVTALATLAGLATDKVDAHLAVIDVGPSLGALNRAALLACDGVIVPLAPDRFSLQGLENVGRTLSEWRDDWSFVRQRQRDESDRAALPSHEFTPIGYVIQQYLVRAGGVTGAYARWMKQIPRVYHDVMGVPPRVVGDMEPSTDRECIHLLKHYASLVPLAQAARKPLFDLKAADGISGSLYKTVAASAAEFEEIVRAIAVRVRLNSLPPRSS